MDKTSVICRPGRLTFVHSSLYTYRYLSLSALREEIEFWDIIQCMDDRKNRLVSSDIVKMFLIQCLERSAWMDHNTHVKIELLKDAARWIRPSSIAADAAVLYCRKLFNPKHIRHLEWTSSFFFVVVFLKVFWQGWRKFFSFTSNSSRNAVLYVLHRLKQQRWEAHHLMESDEMSLWLNVRFNKLADFFFLPKRKKNAQKPLSFYL